MEIKRIVSIILSFVMLTLCPQFICADTINMNSTEETEFIVYDVGSKTEEKQSITPDINYLSETIFNVNPALETRGILGTDERTQVNPPLITTGPYQATCLLTLIFPDGTERCGSGTVVGSNKLVLTAAHCIYNKNYGGYATSITVYPAFSKGASKFGTHTAIGTYIVPAEYITLDNNNPGQYSYEKASVDYGLIKLNSGITGGIQPLNYKVISDDNVFLNNNFYMLGYPGDKTGVASNSTMWRAPTTFQRIDWGTGKPLLITGDGDFVPGMSGGPLVRNFSDGYATVAINVLEGYKFNPENKKEYTLNASVPINTTIASLIESNK